LKLNSIFRTETTASVGGDKTAGGGGGGEGGGGEGGAAAARIASWKSSKAAGGGGGGGRGEGGGGGGGGGKVAAAARIALSKWEAPAAMAEMDAPAGCAICIRIKKSSKLKEEEVVTSQFTLTTTQAMEENERCV
jgi:hypothetical protein